MKPRLKSLQIYEAKNVLCGFDCEGDNYFECGIALDTAKRDYMIPELIAVGVFEDGSVEAGGLFGWNSLNYSDVEDIFLYRYFVYAVDLFRAKAFVRGLVYSGSSKNEKDAKMQILHDCKLCEIHITEEAEAYLNDL